jgi:hypothetical protein
VHPGFNGSASFVTAREVSTGNQIIKTKERTMSITEEVSAAATALINGGMFPGDNEELANIVDGAITDYVAVSLAAMNGTPTDTFVFACKQLARHKVIETLAYRMAEDAVKAYGGSEM